MSDGTNKRRRASRFWARAVGRFLDRFLVRVGLSAAIIVSLIPMPWVDQLDVLFLAVFGTEFLARLWAVLAIPTPPSDAGGLGAATDASREASSEGSRRLGAIALLVVDFVALVSFIPLPVDAEGARWLRLFRLTRMVLLAGYWAPLVRDLWSILARRERARQLVLMGFVVGVLSFAGAVVLYHLGGATIDVTDDGIINAQDRTFGNLLWWAFRQVQDPGNMLASPMALPVVVISVLLTVFGLFLVSFLIGLGTDVVRELLELTRLRPPGLHGHTVVVNITPSTQRLLHELLRYYRKLFPTDARPLSAAWFSDLRRRGFSGPRYLIVGDGSDPPEFLRQPELTRIVYRQRSEDEEELIKRADLLLAKRILLLADQNDDAPDAETIRTLVTLVERVRAKERHADLPPLGRKRVVIAEVMSESNVAAAQAALATGEESFRGFIVPTEKLLALFFASVVRRPGLGHLLEELLTSHGHEIYTCFFQTPGLGYSMNRRPALGPSAKAAIDQLLDRGLSRRAGTVIPVGLLVDREREPGGPDFDVWINPGSMRTDARRAPKYRGFVAIADTFRSVWDLAEALESDEPGRALPAARHDLKIPRLARTHRTKTTRVLMCGFRPGSVYMLEELFRSDPGGEVLVIVENDAARERALEALTDHSQLVERGLLHGRHGTFSAEDGGRVTFRLGEDREPSVMHLCAADWMASRHLVDLPAGFGHCGDLDAIVFVASDRKSADKRTTTALLKLEQLFSGRERAPRIVAEVIDGRLATRLEQRCHELGIEDVRVFSIQELRAYFLFQSVVVPGFDAVYAELLGSWGQSFVHAEVVGAPRGPSSFEAMAIDLRRRGKVLVAVELASDAGRTQMYVAPGAGEPGVTFDLADLRGVWMIAPDSGRDDEASESEAAE